MDTSLIAAFAAAGTAIASVATGAMGYKLAARRASGLINTTDADALWQEASALRRAYQTDIAALRRELIDAQLERGLLIQRISHLEEELRAKDTRIEHLETENTGLKARVSELENELRQRLKAAQIATGEGAL